ncbi:hypothetical protein [Sphingobacterium sp.]|uniref:hypothetical protein n=1 Tax=Sphingobacterium sp. TaxID=341027 RepID=UPI0028A6AA63|nr:hypothetical protein [Sphingobacterium sp.]
MSHNLRLSISPFIIQLLLLLLYSSFAQSQTVKSLTIASPTQAVLFVTNESDKSTDFIMRLHEKNAAAIFKQVPFSTTKLLVTKTDAKKLTFIVKNQQWTIDVLSLKQRHAMILFDGLGKPKIIYDSNTYLAATKPILNNNTQVASKKPSAQYNARHFFDSIAQVQFIPSKQYAAAIIANPALPLYYSQRKNKCDGTYVMQQFSDEKEVQSGAIMTTVYEEGKELTSNNLSGGNNYFSKRFYNQLGLIDSIQYLQNSKWSSSTIYRYLPNAIVSYDPTLQSAMIYHLDSKLQVIKSESIHFVYQRIDWTIYQYDEQNRIVEEISGRNDQVENRVHYLYSNPEISEYSQRQTFDQTGRLTAEIKRSYRVNETIDEFYYEGVLQQKSIVKDLGNCAYESLIYNKDGQLTAKYRQARRTM